MFFKVFDSVTKQYIDKDNIIEGQFASGFLVDRNGNLYEVSAMGTLLTQARDRFILKKGDAG